MDSMSIVMIYHGIKTEFRNHGKRESFEYFISIIREKAKCVLLEEGVNLDSQTQKFARRYEGERERALKSFEILGSAS